MAAITSVTFDKAAYDQGDTVTCTVEYSPDVPSVAVSAQDATADLVNAGGTVTASLGAGFTVAVPQEGADKVRVSDVTGRQWTEVSDTGAVAVFTATA